MGPLPEFQRDHFDEWISQALRADLEEARPSAQVWQRLARSFRAQARGPLAGQRRAQVESRPGWRWGSERRPRPDQWMEEDLWWLLLVRRPVSYG